MSDNIPNKEIKPWPLVGYVPGNYMNHCGICDKQMTGVDKRCFMCLECAAIAANKCIAQLKKDLSEAARHHLSPVGQKDFQRRVNDWIQECFGEEISKDKTERNHRFLEESLELVQSIGCTKSEAHQLVDYVFDRPVGESKQEIGGVVVTLAALCLANGFDMTDCGETELTRIWTKIEKIRAKQAAKPKHSPLPSTPQPEHPSSLTGDAVEWMDNTISVTQLNIERLEVNCFNEDSEMCIRVGQSAYQALSVGEAKELANFIVSHIKNETEANTDYPAVQIIENKK